MKLNRNLKYLTILLIVTVWCVPVFASVSHINCACCTPKKSCCDKSRQNSVKINNDDETNCPQCKCRISEKSAPKNTYLTTSEHAKKNFEFNIYNNDTIFSSVLPETGVMLSSQTNHFKFTPLFIKNSSFLI